MTARRTIEGWRRIGAVLMLCAAGGGVATASGGAAGALVIQNAWIRLLPAPLPLAAYCTLRNTAAHSVAIRGVTSSAFGDIMMHRSIESAGVSRMIAAMRIEIAAGALLRFAPGGYHLMLMGRTAPLREGELVPLTFHLDGGGTVTGMFRVLGADAAP